MSDHALEIRSLGRTWPACSLREKRIRLLEEKLRTAVIEARLLGFSRGELGEMLGRFDEEES